MKKFLFLILLFSSYAAFSQSAKEADFKNMVKKVVTALSNQGSIEANKYIHSKIGVSHIHRMGVYDFFDQIDTISFSSGAYPSVLLTLAKNIKLSPVQFDKGFPIFNCNTEKWNKNGVYSSRNKIFHPLSDIARSLNKSHEIIYPKIEVQRYIDLENKSRKVIAIDKNGAELVFYLGYIDKKWWLTIIDGATSDC